MNNYASSFFRKTRVDSVYCRRKSARGHPMEGGAAFLFTNMK